jgi:predicted cupin superfamily sugar epimerase
MKCTATDIINLLDLRPHPEGGHFRETFRDAPLSTLPGSAGVPPALLQGEPGGTPALPGTAGSGRTASTAIYFLLSRGERSHWHRIDAAEVWHYYAGAPLALEIADMDEGPIRRLRLGADFSAGERPQAVVPRHAWQAAESLGAWTLVGCTVAPGFDFAGFELAPQGWSPQP